MRAAQKTIQRPVERSGVGVNLGREVTVVLRAAPPDTGIVFVRTDLPGSPSVPATPEHVAPDRLRRTVLRRGDAEIQMVEHLLAAAAGLGIDNLFVDVSGPELPVGDGSARHFAEMLGEAGATEQDQPRRCLALRKPITIAEGDATLAALPSADGLTIAYTLDYGQPGLPTQHVEVAITPETFAAELAPARTFVLESEAQALLAAGYGRAASHENTLVIAGDGSVVGNTLRFDDELARHKVLDLLGDLRLAGPALLARVVGVKSGHAQNIRLVRRVARDAAPPDAVSLDIRDILSIVPHRYPFLLVDRVVQIEAGKRAVAVKNVTINEPFFTGHFPGLPVMPGVLLIEAMAQTSGLLLYQGCTTTDTIAHLAAVDGAKFRRPVVPGDQVRIEVEALRMGTRNCKTAARALVDGEVAAEATITFVMADRPHTDD